MTRTNKALTAWAVLCVSVSMAVLMTHTQTLPHYITLHHNGTTVQCERITDVTGRTFYDSCTRKP